MHAKRANNRCFSCHAYARVYIRKKKTLFYATPRVLRAAVPRAFMLRHITQTRCRAIMQPKRCRRSIYLRLIICRYDEADARHNTTPSTSRYARAPPRRLRCMAQRHDVLIAAPRKTVVTLWSRHHAITPRHAITRRLIFMRQRAIIIFMPPRRYY